MLPLLPAIPPPPFDDVQLGPLTLHGYGLVLGIAIIMAIRIAEWGLDRQGQDASRFTGLALVSVLAGFVGARLYHVASEPVRYLEAPVDILKVWNGGLGIYGGVLLGAIVGLWLAPRYGLDRRATADAVVPAILAAQALGRLGNYLNQELFGRPFDGPWALEVDPAFRPFGLEDVATYHPTFLYEALGTGLLAVGFALLLTRWRTRPPGILLALYVTAYSTVRILVEPLRIDDAHELLGVRQNVWVAGVLILLGLAAAWRMRRMTSVQQGG